MKKSVTNENIYSLKNKIMPVFHLMTINDEKISLDSIKGKPTIISFWFTNCSPCLKEIPILNEVKKKYDTTVNFISITFQKKEEINSFLQSNHFDFKHLIDAKEYIKKIGLTTYPKTIILDKEMQVIEILKKDDLDNLKNNIIETLKPFF